MFASLKSQCSPRPAAGLNAFKPQHNLLGNFRLFLENPFSLPTIATLLLVIMLLSLGTQSPCPSCSEGLVPAILLTESLTGFRNVHHVYVKTVVMEKKLFIFS